MTAVYQFVPSYVAHTAIGTHTREVAAVLRSMGITTHAYVGEARGIPAGEHSPFRSFRPAPGGAAGEPTWLLYQLSTGSPMAEALRARSEPLIVNYHNITPADFLRPWEPLVAREVAQGRDQLRRLATRSCLAIADSSFNGAELRAEGYRPTVVVPVLVDLERLGSQVDQSLRDALHLVARTTWLFVGRIAPNKRQDRLISALAAYRRLYDPNARLQLVGGSSSDAYLRALRAYAERLGVAEAVSITGAVSQPELVAYYRSASVFVCLSEHEGFCVPLLEAMWHRLPIVALGATAVPETLGGAGVLLPWAAGRQPPAAVVAAAVHKVLTDASLAARLVALGAARAASLTISATAPRFRAAIAALVEAA